ncbi:MAG TPA: hypothetical protein VNQ33_03590, partial [Acidimicrobiales bacterium]|nr:hypothetical protein [Acidimicrobiales bacterium]
MPFLRRPLVVGALLVVLAVTGCSGAKGGAVSSGGSSSTVPTTEATTTTAEATTTTAAPTTTTEATTTTTTAPVDPTSVAEPAGEPLRSGSVGSRTKAVQQALADQHYDP